MSMFSTIRALPGNAWAGLKAETAVLPSSLSVALKRFAGENPGLPTLAGKVGIEKFLSEATAADLQRVGENIQRRRLGESQNTDDLANIMNIPRNKLEVVMMGGHRSLLLPEFVNFVTHATPDQSSELGRALKRIRQDAKVEANDLASQLRITPAQLRNIESGNVAGASFLRGPDGLRVVGELLKLEEGTNAREFARAAKISVSVLRGMEAGSHRGSPKIFEKIAQHFDIPIEALL